MNNYLNCKEYTQREAMVIYAARELRRMEGKVGLIGVGLPFLAFRVSRAVYGTDLKVVVEEGAFDPAFAEVPISTCDSRLVLGASSVAGAVEAIPTLCRGRTYFGFIGGAQVDKYGNVNSTVIGDFFKPTVRLAGSGGAVDVGCFASESIILMMHQKRRIVERVDYLTTPGWMVKKWPEGTFVRREEIGLKGGPSTVVTSLGILKFDEKTKEMYVEKIYPGVTKEQIKDNTGFDIDVGRAIPAEPLTKEELKILREEVDPLNMYRTR